MSRDTTAQVRSASSVPGPGRRHREEPEAHEPGRRPARLHHEIPDPLVSRREDGKAQRLERLGLVRRARDADDARASLLRLSPPGQEAIERFLLARHQWLTMLLADWPPEERCEFARLLGRFAGDICQHLDDLDT